MWRIHGAKLSAPVADCKCDYRNAFSAYLFHCNPRSASAGGFITPNTSGSGDVQSTPNGGTRFSYVEANNSHCCEFLPIAPSVTINSVSTTAIISSGNLTTIDRTATTPALASAGQSVTGNRLCFIPPITSTISFTVTSVSTNPTNIEVQCNETTLFGGYNTNANPYNFGNQQFDELIHQRSNLCNEL